MSFPCDNWWDDRFFLSNSYYLSCENLGTFNIYPNKMWWSPCKNPAQKVHKLADNFFKCFLIEKYILIELSVRCVPWSIDNKWAMACHIKTIFGWMRWGSALIMWSGTCRLKSGDSACYVTSWIRTQDSGRIYSTWIYTVLLFTRYTQVCQYRINTILPDTKLICMLGDFY